MIDISKTAYKIYLLRETGDYLNITNIVSSPSWQENEGELAMSISLTLADIVYNGTKVASIAKPNCYIVINSEISGNAEEVARGKIVDWTLDRSGSKDDVKLVCYDELYDLQASQDNRYISEGTSTETALKSVFDDWGIPLETYEGPTIAHAKTLFKNENLSDIALELLDDAHKHGADDCFIRASKGKVSVLKKGGNDTVYCFAEDSNLTTSKYKISTADLVTVVKVVAAEDSEGLQAIEAIVEGQTEYGKRQKIYVRDSDDTLATATAAAQEILDEDGVPEETFTVTAADVPMIRKYDKIYITAYAYTGYALVKSISHNAANKTMTMELEKFGG